MFPPIGWLSENNRDPTQDEWREKGSFPIAKLYAVAEIPATHDIVMKPTTALPYPSEGFKMPSILAEDVPGTQIISNVAASHPAIPTVVLTLSALHAALTIT